MNLADALDELRAGILRDASTLKNGPPDHYWTDARLVRYLDWAHKRFARKSLCIRDDTTPECTQVVLVNGLNTDGTTNYPATIYQLHPSVVHVISARHQDDAQDLRNATHNLLANTMNPFTEPTFDFAQIANSGKPSMYTTDEGMDPNEDHAIRMRFSGTPDSGQVGKVVYMRVIRAPLYDLTLDDVDASLEIPEVWHLDMIEGAAWRALRNWDVDGEDRSKASQHKDQFENAIKECVREVQRKQWAPVTWSFGQGGFGNYVHNNQGS